MYEICYMDKTYVKLEKKTHQCKHTTYTWTCLVICAETTNWKVLSCICTAILW